MRLWPSPASFSVKGAGHHTVDYYAKNSIGARSVSQTGCVNIEVTPPVTTAARVPAGWQQLAVLVPLHAVDADSGVAGTYFKIDGGAWQPGDGGALIPAPADHSMDGSHTVAYHSVDVAGNSEATQTFVVRIDTRQPVTKAPAAASVVRNHTVKLKYKVVDAAPCAGRADLKIAIKDRSGKIVKQLSRKDAKTGVLLTSKFLCKLRRGTYHFSVYATDAAGNIQSTVGSNRLTVR